MEKIDLINYTKPSDYYKVTEGKHVIKVLTDGYLIRKHGSRMNGRWIPLGECQGALCEFCEKGNEPKLSFLWIILDRINSKVKVLECSPRLGDLIASELKKNIGKKVDITIVRKGTTMHNTNYTITVADLKETTEEEKRVYSLVYPVLFKKYIK